MTVPEGSTAPQSPPNAIPPGMWGEAPPLSDADRAWLRERILRRLRREGGR